MKIPRSYNGYMTKALRGINLGGWLVAERWMTPELFQDITDQGERAIGREVGFDTASRRLEAHRRTFITEEDFRAIADLGFEVVRLPVGYWLFEDDEGFVSGESYVDKAFRWAMKHKLGVILDFHGLQGSQNGYDHSGQAGKVQFYKRANRRRALQTMKHLSQRYGHEPALVAIEIINEPKVRWFLWRLLRYYDDAFRVAQRFVAPNVKIIVSDAFKPLRMAKALARRNYGEQLVLDVHLYQAFSGHDQTQTFEQHIQKVTNDWQALLTELREYVPEILVGEWSAGLPSNAYDGLVGGEAENVAEYYTAQERLFDELSWGHCYWSYRTPGGGVWDYRTMARYLSTTP